MAEIVIERVHFHREHGDRPILIERSPNFDASLLAPLTDILIAFGDRPPGTACPGAIFAQPVEKTHVAVVHVRDAPTGPSGWAGLNFRVLILTTRAYDILGGDPFALARTAPGFLPDPELALASATPSKPERDCRPIHLPEQPLVPRDLAHIQAVLKRIKAHALPENTDPASPPPLTIENAESPTLLGAAQVLVDGGKLIFERSKPDASVIEALWTLLPHALRPRIWPASFAFTNDLGFEVLVVPRLDSFALDGYTTEEQAGDYPQGSYELALQTAAESGDANDLERVFQRRTSNDTFWLGVKLLIGLSLIVAAFRFLPTGTRVDVAPRAATVAGIVGARDPWMVLFQIEHGNRAFLKSEPPPKR